MIRSLVTASEEPDILSNFWNRKLDGVPTREQDPIAECSDDVAEDAIAASLDVHHGRARDREVEHERVPIRERHPATVRPQRPSPATQKTVEGG